MDVYYSDDELPPPKLHTLNGPDDWALWSVRLHCAFVEAGVQAVVDGSWQRPSKRVDADQEGERGGGGEGGASSQVPYVSVKERSLSEWIRCNHIALELINASISLRILLQVERHETASERYTAIHTYLRGQLTSFDVRRELYSLKQGPLSIDAFSDAIDTVCSKFDLLGEEVEPSLREFVLVDGLSNVHSSFRAALLVDFDRRSTIRERCGEEVLKRVDPETDEERYVRIMHRLRIEEERIKRESLSCIGGGGGAGSGIIASPRTAIVSGGRIVQQHTGPRTVIGLRVGGGGSGGGSGAQSTQRSRLYQSKICLYCKRRGHVEEECRNKLRDMGYYP